MPKRVYTCDETFRAVAEISNYGPKNLPVKPEWTLADESGRTIAGGSLPATVAETGKVSGLGEISAPLRTVGKAARLTLTLKAGGTSNSWNIWVRPGSRKRRPEYGSPTNTIGRPATHWRAASAYCCFPTRPKDFTKSTE